MKKLIKPTRAERQLIEKRGWNSDNWQIERKTHETLTLVHKVNGSKRLLHIQGGK